MRVVGIDFRSEAMDLVTLHLEATDNPRWHHIALPGSFKGARTMPEHLFPSSWWEDVYLCAIEKPMSPFRNSISAQMRVQGAILATIPQHVEVWEFQPEEWKLGCGLKGNASKNTVAGWALDHGADHEWTQDAYDALGIATAALRINTTAIEKAA